MTKKRTQAGYEKRTTPFHIVYCLMNGYVGVTNNPYFRMSNHKNKGRDTEGWFILAITETKKEALAIEREYHMNETARGNNSLKKKPILQLTLEGELIREWSSMKEAAKGIGIPQPSISNACTGRRKSGHGFRWEFK